MDSVNHCPKVGFGGTEITTNTSLLWDGFDFPPKIYSEIIVHRGGHVLVIGMVW